MLLLELPQHFLRSLRGRLHVMVEDLRDLTQEGPGDHEPYRVRDVVAASCQLVKLGEVSCDEMDLCGSSSICLLHHILPYANNFSLKFVAHIPELRLGHLSSRCFRGQS